MHNPDRRGRRLLATGALAACLLSLFLGSCGGDDEPQQIPLDEGELRCVSPQGAGADLSLFEWAGELPEGGYFQMVVYDYNAGGQPLGPLVRSPELQGRSWAPRANFVEGFPDEIFWKVFTVSAGRETVARAEATASR